MLVEVNGPIAVCIAKARPMYQEWVELVESIVGDGLVTINRNDAGLLPSNCAGVIGLNMWDIHQACLEQNIRVYMIDQLPNNDPDLEWDHEHGIPGMVRLEPGQNWRPLVEDLSRKLLRHRAGLWQRDSPEGATFWEPRLHGISGDTYSFDGLINLGGTASVARLRSNTGIIFAGKVLSGHRFPVTLEMKQRFEREARLLRAIDHPRVLRLVDEAQMNDKLVLVLEYLDGGSLYESLLNNPHPDYRTAIQWLQWALEGAAVLHAQSIVHRDISPKNLLFQGDGELVVADFGTVRHIDDVTLTSSKEAIGSLIYIAPEQFLSPRDATTSSDVYSLGQIGFQLVTGISPQGNVGKTTKHAPSIPYEVAATIDKMRSYKAGSRPSDASAALKVLQEALDKAGKFVEPPHPPPWAALILLLEATYGWLELISEHISVRKPSQTTPVDAAELVQRDIFHACSATTAWLKRCIHSGLVLREALTPEQVAADPDEIWILRAPVIKIEWGRFDNPDHCFRSITEGSATLFSLLHAWRSELIKGQVALVPMSIDILEHTRGNTGRMHNSGYEILNAIGELGI